MQWIESNLTKALSLDRNVQESWKICKQNFGFYLTTNEYTGKTEEVKAGLFLHCVGDAARQIYNTLTFEDKGNSKNIRKSWRNLKHYEPSKDIFQTTNLSDFHSYILAALTVRNIFIVNEYFTKQQWKYFEEAENHMRLELPCILQGIIFLHIDKKVNVLTSISQKRKFL